MSLTIAIPQSIETRLAAKAKAEGVDLVAYTRRVLQADALLPSLPPVGSGEYRKAHGTLTGTGAFKPLLDQRQREREIQPCVTTQPEVLVAAGSAGAGTPIFPAVYRRLKR